MILSELQSELQARGFDYLSITRQNIFLNRAYSEISEEEDWPFLEASSTGTMPLTISDLRTLESVIDTTQLNKLRPVDRRFITDFDPTYAETGVPDWYYLTTGGIVNVYPANTTDSFTVRYWKTVTELSAAGDEPVIPARFHNLIVDKACAYAYFDSDNIEAGQSMLGLAAEGVERMRQSLLVQQHDEPDDYVVLHNMDQP